MIDSENFKDTKLGIIPYDWQIKKIKSFAKVITGSTPSTKDLSNYGDEFLFVSPADLGKSKFITRAKKKLSEKGFNSSRKMPENSILFTCIGSTIGKIGLSREDLTSNQQINAILPNDNYVSHHLYYELQRLAPRIKSLASEQAVPMINKSEFESFQVVFPPLKEQQKIAQILSQWDEAIETTQNLITQLQLRKKGLMQELLSGKKRLAGFSEEWKTIRGDKLFASISNKKHNGEFEVLSATQDKGVIPRSETGIDIKYDKKSLGNYKKLDIGDFVISLRSFQGGIEYSNYEGLVSPAYTVLREKLPIAKKFYQEYMKTENFINRLNSIIYGIRDGKQISYKEFGSLKFEYPPLEEQEAISKIIVTADAEIKEKQEYLVVLQNQKKGLMQQLLTGQKRVKI